MFFVLFSSLLGAVNLEQLTIDSVQDVIWQANIFKESLKSHESINAILPGSVAFAKSNSSVPGYKDGVYQFVIQPSNQKHIYRFEELELLQNKQGLLHITIEGQAIGSQFILPSMDAVIEGKHIGGANFLLGYDQKALSNPKGQVKNKFFFLAGHEEFHTPVLFFTRHDQPVFATNPKSFIGKDGGQPREVEKLVYKDALKQFFFDHTRGFSQIPKTKADLNTANMLETDAHSRPARKHQIKQILEYVVARDNGVKHMTFAAATGSGKTNTMLRLAELVRPKKVLIVTPRENLITQIIEESRQHYPHVKIGGSNESNRTIAVFLHNALSNNDITVTSLQGFKQESVYKNSGLLSKIDVIIFDEAHNFFPQKEK